MRQQWTICIREGTRDEGNILDLNDCSFPSKPLVLAIGRHFFTDEKAEGVKGVPPEFPLPPLNGITIILEVAVGAIAVILSTLTLVNGLREILQFCLRERPGKYFKEIIFLALCEGSRRTHDR